MDRYFQIVKCFRDEDLRADRQPEFTQIDIEMSFVDEDAVFAAVEHLMQAVFRQIGREVEAPFPRLTYDDAMRRYGSDKPDLRFRHAGAGRVGGVPGRAVQGVPRHRRGRRRGQRCWSCRGAGRQARAQIDKLVDEAIELGAKGLSGCGRRRTARSRAPS